VRLGYSALPSTSHGRGTSRGPSAVENMCILGVLSGPLRLSVQVGGLGRPAVFMVRRRSTVRFRKGAPQGLQAAGFGYALAGQWAGRTQAMTTGTTLAFIVTSTIVLVAVVGGIWLEAWMPDQQQRRLGPIRQSRLATKPAAGQRMDLSGPAWDVPLARGRHHRQTATAHRQDSLYGRHRANF